MDQPRSGFLQTIDVPVQPGDNLLLLLVRYVGQRVDIGGQAR